MMLCDKNHINCDSICQSPQRIFCTFVAERALAMASFDKKHLFIEESLLLEEFYSNFARNY